MWDNFVLCRGETSQPAELEEMTRAANPEEIDIDDEEDEDGDEDRQGGKYMLV